MSMLISKKKRKFTTTIIHSANLIRSWPSLLPEQSKIIKKNIHPPHCIYVLVYATLSFLLHFSESPIVLTYNKIDLIRTLPFLSHLCSPEGFSQHLRGTVHFWGHFHFSEFWQFHMNRDHKWMNLRYVLQKSWGHFLRYGTPDPLFWANFNFFFIFP